MLPPHSQQETGGYEEGFYSAVAIVPQPTEWEHNSQTFQEPQTEVTHQEMTQEQMGLEVQTRTTTKKKRQSN